MLVAVILLGRSSLLLGYGLCAFNDCWLGTDMTWYISTTYYVTVLQTLKNCALTTTLSCCHFVCYPILTTLGPPLAILAACVAGLLQKWASFGLQLWKALRKGIEMRSANESRRMLGSQHILRSCASAQRPEFHKRLTISVENGWDWDLLGSFGRFLGTLSPSLGSNPSQVRELALGSLGVRILRCCC